MYSNLLHAFCSPIDPCTANEPSMLGWQLYCHPFPGAAVQLPHERGLIDHARLNSRLGLLAIMVAALQALTGGYAYAGAFDGEILNFSENQIYHSPEKPGFTCWVGLWQVPKGPIQCGFTQRTLSGDIHPVLETTNAGQTWTRAAGDIPIGFCRGMAVLDDGLTMVRRDWTSSATGISGYVQRSTDGGRNWGDWITLLPPDQYRTEPSLIRPLRDGRLVLMSGVYKRDPNNPKPDNNTILANDVKTMFISKDQGKTWGAPIMLMPKATGVGEESDFVELPNGDLLWVHRACHVSPDGKRYTENKLTSSVAKRTGDTFEPGPASVPFPVPSPLPRDSVGFPCVLLTTEGVILDLSHIGCHYSADLGRTWHQLMVGGRQLETPYYPQALQAADETIVVVGHRGGDDKFGTVDQAIIQQTFRLSPVSEQAIRSDGASVRP
jgi:hypothetical protein